MNVLVSLLSTEKGTLGRLIAKFRRFGREDIQTSIVAAPFGDDSNPVKGMVGVYAPTSEIGKTVLIGFFNPDSLAEVGGKRLYSTNESGEVQALIYWRADGSLEINGDADNLVRYSELKKAFDELKTDHNKLVTAFNTHLHPTAAVGPPSPPTPGAGIPAQPSAADISGAKIDNVKTN